MAAAGMALIGLGSCLLTQVSADATFFGAIFLGLLIFGPGMGAAFVAAQIAAFGGVAEHDSGLASGIEETTFTIGSALGVAILSTIAVSQPDLVAGARAAAFATVFPASRPERVPAAS